MFLKQYKNFRINVLFQFHEFSEDKWNFSALMLSINRQIVVIVVGSIPVFSPGTLSLLIEGIDPAESQLNNCHIKQTPDSKWRGRLNWGKNQNKKNP